MTAHRWAGLALLVALTACNEPQAAWVRTSFGSREAQVRLILAKQASLEKGVTDVTDLFSVGDTLHAYATIKTRDGEGLGTQGVEARWFREGAQVAHSQYQSEFTYSPWNIWFPLPAQQLGPCKGRVDLYSQGHLIGTRTFEIR